MLLLMAVTMLETAVANATMVITKAESRGKIFFQYQDFGWSEVELKPDSGREVSKKGSDWLGFTLYDFIIALVPGIPMTIPMELLLGVIADHSLKLTDVFERADGTDGAIEIGVEVVLKKTVRFKMDDGTLAIKIV